MPYRSAALNAVGIKLYADRLRIDAIEKDLNLKLMPISMIGNLQFTEAQRGPMFFQTVLPSDDLPANGTLIGNARTV